MPVFSCDQEAVPASSRAEMNIWKKVRINVLPGEKDLPTSERFELSHEFRIGCLTDRLVQFNLLCVTNSNPTP